MAILMHSKLSQEKKICLSLLGLLLILPLLVWYLTSVSFSQKELCAEAIQESCSTLQKLAGEQEVNRITLSQFQNKDPLYLQRQIEPLLLLQKELKEIENDPISSYLPLSKEQKARTAFLSSNENRFSFVEGKVLQNPMMKETIETQNKVLELDQKDLEKVLLLVEGSTIPQEPSTQQILDKKPLLLTEIAELERKKKNEREVWLFKIKFIKRVFGTHAEAK